MLILTRKVGQQVVIGDGAIVVEILENKMGSIKLGFNAADEITIDRGEIHRRKQAANQEMIDACSSYEPN